MLEFEGTSDNNTINTLFRDALMGVLGAVVLSLVIILYHINDPKKNDEENQRARGNIRVEVIWDENTNVDIDTWVKAPGDTPVGYSNLNGRVFNLVRDDLGNYNDLTEMNYEVAFSRGIPKGEWIINLHWFSNAAGVVEVPVKVLITMKKKDDEVSKESPLTIMSKHVVLTRVGEEFTVIRFVIDENKDIDQSSFTTATRIIRPMGSDDDYGGGP